MDDCENDTYTDEFGVVWKPSGREDADGNIHWIKADTQPKKPKKKKPQPKNPPGFTDDYKDPTYDV